MRTYIFTLDTGRFGDEVVVKAETVEEARKGLTRTQKTKVKSVREFIGTSARREAALAAGQSFPLPVGGRR